MVEAAKGRRGPRPTGERLHRLLVMLPWLAQRGEVLVADMAAQFHVSAAELVSDLELAAICGLPPYEDELIDLYVDDGPGGLTVYAGIPRLFTKPFRLTAPEGFSLLAAGRAALALPGAESSGPLGRALDKLEHTLGGRTVVIDATPPPHADALAAAVIANAVLAVRYWTASRDEVNERRIVARLVFSDRGDWYVIADDERSGEQRTFRVDRIEALTDTGERAEARRVDAPTAGWFAEGDDVGTAVLVLAPEAAWVVERYPTRSVTTGADGRLEVVLAVASERWFGRLLLRLGAQAEVAEPAAWRDLGATTAARVLARYTAG